MIGLLIMITAVLAFILGRITDGHDAPSPSQVHSPRRTPGSSPPTKRSSHTGLPPERQRILRYFAVTGEEDLPEQGVLGGTMVAGTVAFPKGFEALRGERFFVVGSDGHILETWTYELRSRTAFRHIATHDGYAPVDFEDRPDRFDVYLWRPAHYLPAD